MDSACLLLIRRLRIIFVSIWSINWESTSKSDVALGSRTVVSEGLQAEQGNLVENWHPEMTKAMCRLDWPFFPEHLSQETLDKEAPQTWTHKGSTEHVHACFLFHLGVAKTTTL